MNDFTGRVFKTTSILMLSEKFMNDNEPVVSVPNFDLIIKFQRNDVKNSGVTIYRNDKDNHHVITPHLEINPPYSCNADVTISTSIRIGDLCVESTTAKIIVRN